MVNPEPFFQELEAQGEAVTRDKVDQNRYAGGRHELALNWLQRKAQMRADALEAEARAARAEEIELARRAAQAAEDAAASAREANAVARDANALASDANTLAERAINKSRDANSTAVLALIASAVSAIVTILALVFGR